MVFDAQNGPQLVIRGISIALKMLNLPQKHPFFTFEAKKPLKQRVGAHFEHQKSFIYIKTCFSVLWLWSNSFNEGSSPPPKPRMQTYCAVHQPNGHLRRKEEGRESAWVCLWTYLKSSDPIFLSWWYCTCTSVEIGTLFFVSIIARTNYHQERKIGSLLFK